MNDAEAFDYYNDPAKRKPTRGAPRRRSAGAADPARAHTVPGRDDPPSQEARHVGVTVSAWIRRAVDETLRCPASLGPAPR